MARPCLLTYLNSITFCQFTRADWFNLCSPQPLIKFLILFCYINLVILDFLIVTLIGSKVTYHLVFLLLVLHVTLPHISHAVTSATILHFGTSVVQYCHAYECDYKTGFGLMIGFVGHFHTARDCTLQFTVTHAH
jgi:hypothetical protein